MKKILVLTAALVMGVATALAVGQFMTSKPATITAKAQWKNVYRTQSGLVAGADLIVLAEHVSADFGRFVGFGEDDARQRASDHMGRHVGFLLIG